MTFKRPLFGHGLVKIKEDCGICEGYYAISRDIDKIQSGKGF